MEPLTKSLILQQIETGLQNRIAAYDEHFEAWRKNLQPYHAFGYNPFGGPIAIAYASAFLYRLRGEEKFAIQAIEQMRDYRQFIQYFPQDYHRFRPEYHDAIPPIPSMFTLWQYALAYTWIKSAPALTATDRETIGQILIDSVPPLVHFPEWGAHNRTILRAFSIAALAQALPENPQYTEWLKMARMFGDDSINHWNIEDAMSYHAIWHHALIWYADVMQIPNFINHPTTHYYFEYFKQLINPSGGLTDFGDSEWQSNLHLFVAILARGAKEYQDPELQWAANRVFETLQRKRSTLFVDESMISTYLWLDDSLEARQPTTGSGDVLDELVGKKIVFRSGWEPDSTYLLLNYKPETDFGETQRENLKNTLSVEAEKAHHGHSDENAICLLMHNQSVLLHEGGYRENLPNGKYRADYYHNRIVFREKPLAPGTAIMDFLQYSGKHQPVETMKIDFKSFEQVDFSRTRVIDSTGYRWDRGLVWLKQPGWFVLFDTVKILPKNGRPDAQEISLANLFFTRQILAQGSNWFDTRIDQLREIPLPDTSRLLIYFPQAGQDGIWAGTQNTRRYYQDEIVVHQSRSRKAAPGEFLTFITVLIPHAPDADLNSLVESVRIPAVDRFPEAAALELDFRGQTLTCGMKLNPEAELLEANIRPRYNWESGKVNYGPVETDARFFYCNQQQKLLYFCLTEAIKLNYRKQTVFAAKPTAWPLQYSGEETQMGICKWRCREDTVCLEK